ncbi:TraB/GumN family protein [Massilia dura]|uniref:TraB/GumN family protein n=1 Tax=Pseudoduganella dura TaxID=321982 RepID=A0A6I3XQ80_9BURK|nr:TraB/GumN family protein [Pseudoduganella dura]MUI13925.1 TraB/GumN family protein [Pseudoduganella dura]GGX99062.1 GumN protein [Pseudoduganella dura]
MRRPKFSPKFSPFLPVLCLSLLSAPAWAQADAPQPEPVAAEAAVAPEAAPEQILVVGQKPGPGLWKVSRGDHVMWVFGTYGPLPKNMEWRSQQVESKIAQSQELITEPGATLGMGFFRSLTALPFMIGFEDSPDGKVLSDLVPADTYQRWLALRKKYLEDDDSYERKRPQFAAGKLTDKATAAAGLSKRMDLTDKLVQIAKQNKVKVTSATVKMELDSPVAAIREFKKTPLEDVPCFTKTIERLETDLDALRARANAWSKGDIEAIRALDFSEQETACLNAVQNSKIMQERGLGGIDTRMRASWLGAAEKALAANKTTFAVLQIKHIIGKQAYLAELQAKGYVVEQPE